MKLESLVGKFAARTRPKTTLSGTIDGSFMTDIIKVLALLNGVAYYIRYRKPNFTGILPPVWNDDHWTEVDVSILEQAEKAANAASEVPAS